tara:strand:+ start:6573 stop:7076 length:504 start_codon:yes stop_codon:yes gene_type:complete
MELESKETESEYKASVDDKGNVVLKKSEKIRKGRKSRAAGGQFELRVRKDLEAKGWIVDKWSNNVDLDEKKVIPAKRKFNPFSKVMTIGTGFPDFIAFQMIDSEKARYKVIGVEVKMNGTLSKIEKEKCQFLVDRDIFNEIWVARKIKKGRRVFVEYRNFNEKWEKY